MPYLTLTENLKLQLSPGLVASYEIQPGNGVGLFWDKHTHVYLLTNLPRTHTGLPMINATAPLDGCNHGSLILVGTDDSSSY